MKFSYDELAGHAADEAAEAADVAEQAAEAVAEPEPVSSEPQVEFEVGPDGNVQMGGTAPAPEMDLKEMMEFAQEVQQPTLQEQVAQLAQDPMIQEAIKTLWYGPDDQADQQPRQVKSQQPQQQPQMQPDSSPENAQPQADGGATADVDLDASPQEAYDVIMTVLAAVADEHPDMTAEAMAGHAQLLTLVAQNVAHARPEMQAEQMEQYGGQFEDQIRQELASLL
jgi:hypothetical protein